MEISVPASLLLGLLETLSQLERNMGEADMPNIPYAKVETQVTQLNTQLRDFLPDDLVDIAFGGQWPGQLTRQIKAHFKE